MSEEYYQKIFSKNLRYYMEKNNKSQIDIINDLGFNKSAVSTWYNGTRLPRMDKVDALAKYFGINRSDLIEEKVHNVDYVVSPGDILIEGGNRDREQAIKLYEAYLKAIPEVQEAVERLLKSDLSDS